MSSSTDSVGGGSTLSDAKPLEPKPSSRSETLSPESILAELSKIREIQPVQALAAADGQRGALTEPLLEALDRGLTDQKQAFESDGVLFNYASYLLAKWREERAFPYFIRWMSLPGEDALELGGDTILQDGSRFLASVCGKDIEPIKQLILNRNANERCRGQAIAALALLVAWEARPQQEIEEFLIYVAREGLERQRSQLWDELAAYCIEIEAIPVFSELRRAREEGLIDERLMRPGILEEVESTPRGQIRQHFAQRRPHITDVTQETRWWSGFSHYPASAPEAGRAASERIVGTPGLVYLAPPRVGRNDLCPCGSGKKFKKCCGE